MGFLSDLKSKIYNGDNLVNLTDIRYLPRWVILLIDMIIVFISALVTYYIAYRFNGHTRVFYNNFQSILYIEAVCLFFMYVFKTYSGVIRHSTFIDLLKLLLAISCSVIILGIINTILYLITGDKLFTPGFAFLSLFAALSCSLLFVFRLVVKEVFHYAREFRKSSMKKKILVVGIGEQSIAVARVINDNPDIPYFVKGFVTQRKDSSYAKLLGKPIYSIDEINESFVENSNLHGALIIKEILSKEEMDLWVNILLENNLQLLKAPTLQKLRKSDRAFALRQLQIEDLLNRKPIKISSDEVKKRHYDKAVLVTGGAGSIGSEIIRQVAQYNPSLIVVFDQAETPLYEIELELKQNFPNVAIQFILGDISNIKTLESIFREYQFSMVYHAAAYKHVPLVESNPQEGSRVNILGTRNVALLASKYKVNRFVMVSTDKAVNPTNVMGATKRIAELFVQALQNTEGNSTKYITTRFGNVLGSNGSVIPHFKKQIEKGGPITITHPDITRYFMTIPEACELVLEAGTMGSGGEIYVFDMGQPVKIVDLARRMIKLSGLRPDEDIKIEYTGLRPGEKLYEELLSDDTKTLPTYNQQIMISKDPSITFEKICTFLNAIEEKTSLKDKVGLVKVMKEIVPEFKSNNSIYESLDSKDD